MTEQKPDTALDPAVNEPVVAFRDLSMHYGKVLALDNVSLEIKPRILVGLIGPDGVGKSSLLSLITGAHAMQKEGTLRVLGGDMRDMAHRNRICPKIAYMPQGLGKNLYFTLTVEENLQFFARLFGQGPEERRKRIDRLTKSTGLYPFLDRPAGKLSGGMKQKLGLCCSLIHDPDLLVLDEPTTGVDPLARRQFWDLIDNIKVEQPNLSVMVATAYMDEAQRFDWLIAMDGGKILDTGTPKELLDKTNSDNLDTAFIRLLPESKRAGHKDLVVPPLGKDADNDISIEAKGLTKRFGDFTAVDHVSFRIRRGEIFGFLGSNGCGKTTTMRMLTGLLPSTEGQAYLFGKPIDGGSMEIRKKLGYMTQLFSLYSELTVKKNLELYARLYGIPEEKVADSVEKMMKRFDLIPVQDTVPADLPLGIKQRLSLAAAVIHNPQIVILDEPTSGVDPVARDSFWELIIELSRKDKVTIFVTTHFMNEAERCDRISLMHCGRSLECDEPAALVKKHNAPSLEAAFIQILEEADPASNAASNEAASVQQTENTEVKSVKKHSAFYNWLNSIFSFQRWYACCWREMLELKRDKIRTTLALYGALILMAVIGLGVSMDVEHIKYAVFDEDQSEISNDYALHISGSKRYFEQKKPITSYPELDARMRSGDVSMAVVIPSGFGQKMQHGDSPPIEYFVDGALTDRAETIAGYIQSVHSTWLDKRTRETDPNAAATASVSVETRYRYNPNVLSLPAMVPGVIALLLMMIPAVLSALAVVREKELGSIINLYVTPLSRLEFLLGKQIPYVVFAMVSAILMVLMSVFIFDVPVKGSLVMLLLSLLLYCMLSTGFGLIASSVTKSQIAVIFMTMLATLLPATTLCGMTNPVSSQEGAAYVIGQIYPTSHMITICRGVFNKSLDFSSLFVPFMVMLIELPIITAAGALLQKKQES